MAEEQREKKTWRNFFIILILLLLGANAWLFYNAYQNKEDRRHLERTIAEADSLNRQMNVRIDSLQSSLELQKGESAEKDSLIAVLQSDLEGRRNEISTLISNKALMSKKNNEVESLLDQARQQIASLENEKIVYQTRIDSLGNAIFLLQGNYDTLQVHYGAAIHNEERLTTEKDSIQSLGEIIAASNITVTGVRTKGKGKEVDDQNAKKTDRLKICFDLAQNKLSAGKQQTIYIKVIDPKGLTLIDATQGSGEFKDMDNNEQSKYTASVTVDYDGKSSKNYCFYWTQTNGYDPGEYTVRLYHNGYYIGESTFTLKKSFL